MAKKKAGKAKPKRKTVAPPVLDVTVFDTFDQQGSAELGHRRNLELADQLGRSWGNSTALPLEMSLAAREKRMPWGILTLDWLTGGIVLEKVNRVWGVKSSLKSTLCLRAVRQAQNHCRHCKTALVRNPGCTCLLALDLKATGQDFEELVCPVKKTREIGIHNRTAMSERRRDDVIPGGDVEARCVDCRCGKPRWWLVNKDDYGWLPAELAILVSQGFIPPDIIQGVQEGRNMVLPEGVITAGVDHCEHAKMGKVVLPYVVCKPPPHAFFTKDGKKRKSAPEPRKVFLGPDTRCEPMRCLYLDSEGTISVWWAQQNGVDTKNVLGVGAGWAEKNLSITEKAVLEGEHDLVVIDSTSMLESEKNLEKAFGATPVVAKHANLMGSFIKRHIAACFEEGLAQRYRPTVLLTSQVTCVDADTFVSTDAGMETAAELHVRVSSGHRALIADMTGHLSPVAGSLDSGIIPTRKIEVEQGYEVITGMNHPFLVLRDDFSVGWVRTEDLCEGDFVAIHPSAVMGGVTDRSEDDLASLAGVWAADGSTRRVGNADTVRIAEKSRERFAYARRSMRAVIGDECRVRPAIGGRNQNVVAVHGALATDLIESGFVGKNRGVADLSLMKRIPRCARRSPSALRSFLRSVSFDTTICRQHVRFSPGRRLSAEIHTAMRFLGIGARLKTTKRGYRHVTVSGDDLALFVAMCGFAEPRKAHAVREMLLRPRQPRWHGLPCDGRRGDVLRSAVVGRLRSQDEVYARAQNAWLRGGRVSFADASSVLELGGAVSPHLAARVREQYLWAPITCLTDMGRRQCYDFEVDSGDTLLANGFVTHNTKGIGLKYRDPWLGPTGGNVLEHGLSLDIRLKPLGYVFDSTNTFAMRGDFEFEVTKTKADRGSPGATGVIRFWVCETNEQKVGDCFVKGTRVLLRDGYRLVPVESVRVGDEIWGWDRWSKVRATWDKGVLPTWLVLLNNGSSMRLTPDHKVWVALCDRHSNRAPGARGCSCPVSERRLERVQLRDLQPGTVLLQPDEIPFGSDEMPEWQAYLEGVFLSDGWHHRDNSIRIGGRDGKPKEAQKREIQLIGDTRGMHTNWYERYITVNVGPDLSARFRAMGSTACVKTALSLDLTEAAIKEMLRGVLANSGRNISSGPPDGGVGDCLLEGGRTFTSTSYELWLQTRVMLKMLGLSCYELPDGIYLRYGTVRKSMWRLGVRRADRTEKLLRVKEVICDDAELPCCDLTTDDHRVWLPEADWTTSQSDDLENVMAYARSFGAPFMLNGSGKATITLYSDYVKDGSVKFARVGDAQRYLLDHPTIYDDLRARVLKQLREQVKPKMGTGQEANKVQRHQQLSHYAGSV